jgi:hypothetical protein
VIEHRSQGHQEQALVNTLDQVVGGNALKPL